MLPLLLAAPALAADPSSFAWLEGLWQGAEGQVAFEEAWQPPLGGARMGTFRLAEGDGIVFYELMTLTGDELRIKHFGGDLQGWERRREVERFLLVDLVGTRAVFRDPKDGKELVYERTGDQLLVRIAQMNTSHPTLVAGPLPPLHPRDPYPALAKYQKTA